MNLLENYSDSTSCLRNGKIYLKIMTCFCQFDFESGCGRECEWMTKGWIRECHIVVNLVSWFYLKCKMNRQWLISIKMQLRFKHCTSKSRKLNTKQKPVISGFNFKLTAIVYKFKTNKKKPILHPWPPGPRPPLDTLCSMLILILNRSCVIPDESVLFQLFFLPNSLFSNWSLQWSLLPIILFCRL